MVLPGKPRGACARARAALTAKADQFARNVAPIVEQIRAQGITFDAEIAGCGVGCRLD